MLESAQKPAEPFPSDDTTALVVGPSAPPSEAVTVTVSKEIMDALKAGYVLYRVVLAKQLICDAQVDLPWS